MLKNKNIILGFSVIALFAAIMGCTKDPEAEGVLLDDIYAPYGIEKAFAVNDTSIDFQKGEKLFFSAEFNAIEQWIITLQSIENMAEKTITGRSKILDASNAVWDGSSDNMYSFIEGNVHITLSVVDTTVIQTESVNIESRRNLQGIKVADFNEGVIDPLWITFLQAGTKMDVTDDSSYHAPSDDPYLLASGAVTWDWAVNMIEFHSKLIYFEDYFPGIQTDPEEVYFNALIHSDTTDANNEGFLLLNLYEDDNYDGKWSEGVDDQYQYRVDLDWIGWEHFSFRYDTLDAVYNANTGANVGLVNEGNATLQPNRILYVEFILLGNPQEGFIHTAIDNIYFTNNEPLKF